MKQMKQNVSLFAVSILILVSVFYISGITFSKTDEQVEEMLKIVYTEEEKKILSADEPYLESVVIENSSKKDLFVRIKIEVPKVNGEKLILVGRLSKEKFIASSFSSAEQESAEQYWEKKGDYIYYRNSRTGDVLKSGESSSEIYEAVMLNEKAPVGTQNSIVILAEYSETKWKDM